MEQLGKQQEVILLDSQPSFGYQLTPAGDCELPDGKRLAYYEWVQNISYAKYQKNPGSTYDDCRFQDWCYWIFADG